MAEKNKQKGGPGQTGGTTPAGTTPGGPVTVTPTPAPTPAPAPAASAQAAATAAPVKPLTKMEVLEQKVAVLEATVYAMQKYISEGGTVAGKGGPKPKFGGKRGATPTKDTTTGALYVSKSACAKAVAAEAGLDPNNHYAWYDLLKMFPGRFMDCTPQEAEIIIAQHDAEVQASIDAANAKLAADAAAANAANAAANKTGQK